MWHVHAPVLVASLSFSVDPHLFLSSFCVPCRPRYVHFARRNELRRDACRRGDVLVGRLSLFAASVSHCGRSCMTTRQFVTFLVVPVKPQQTPESSIWPHIGTRSSGGIRSVVPHASSIELDFGFLRAE